MRVQENLEKSKYEADGSLQIQGTIIPYHTICEDNFLWMKKKIQSHPYLVMPILEVIFKTIQNVPSYLFIMAVQDVQVFGFTWDSLVLELQN